MSHSNISNSDTAHNLGCSEDRMSSLSGTDRSHLILTFANPNEDDDFSLEAKFDSYGCVSDIEIIV